MNRPSSESLQIYLNDRVAREIDQKSIDQHFKECSLREIPSVRKEGDSNPRYGNPYGSLANCWFQPLTHPSKRTLEFETVGLSPQLRVQRYDYFLNLANFSKTFFTFCMIFLVFTLFEWGRRSGLRDSNPRPSAWEANALPTELIPPGRKRSQNKDVADSRKVSR